MTIASPALWIGTVAALIGLLALDFLATRPYVRRDEIRTLP